MKAWLLTTAAMAVGAAGYSSYVGYGQQNEIRAELEAIRGELAKQQAMLVRQTSDQYAVLLEIHKDIVRQEAKQDAVRMAAQSRVNRLNNDAQEFMRAVPK